MATPYPFEETLSRLDEIDGWLKSLGYGAYDRIRRYRRNFRDMLELQSDEAVDSVQALQKMTEEKRREIFWSYVEAEEFVRAVGPLRDCLGDRLPAVPIDRALGGPADLFLENERNNAGRNFMFELIMGGRLAKAGITPLFDRGPDVQFDFSGLRVAMQCKRPFSKDSLERNISGAISQLKVDNADLNLIAVSVSRLWNPGEPNDVPLVEDPVAGQAYLAARGREIADESRRFWTERLNRGGILFYGYCPVSWPMDDGSYGHATLRAETMCPVMARDTVTKLRLRNLVRVLKA
jgi:hypothetical protein